MYTIFAPGLGSVCPPYEEIASLAAVQGHLPLFFVIE